jgi:hypothetical protein
MSMGAFRDSVMVTNVGYRGFTRPPACGANSATASFEENFMNPFTMRLGMNLNCAEYPQTLSKNLNQSWYVHLSHFGWILALMGAAVSVFVSTDIACAQDSKNPMVIHVVYGRLLVDNDDPDLEGGDFDIRLFGADAQKPFGGKTFKFGIEVGGLFNWDSEVRSVAASSGKGGGMVAVSLDIESFLFDYYFGGYLSFEPARWIRLFVGAGPLIIWGWREVQNEATDSQPSESESEYDLGTGLYGRAGLDILIAKNVGLTAEVRSNKTTLSFEDTAGEVDVEGLQYYGGLVLRF